MRRIALWTVATLVLAVGCEKKQPKAPEAPATETTGQAAQKSPEDNNTILLGEVGSLTGAEATFGISTRNGIELAHRARRTRPAA